MVKLTLREKEVLKLTAEGLTAKEAGAALFLSPRTIEDYLESIRKKTGLRNKTELVRFALANLNGVP